MAGVGAAGVRSQAARLSAASPMRRGVLPGVTVDLHSYGMETTAITDGTGDYRIEDVPAGPAELTFKLINFTIVRRTLIVIPGQTVTADAACSDFR